MQGLALSRQSAWPSTGALDLHSFRRWQCKQSGTSCMPQMTTAEATVAALIAHRHRHDLRAAGRAERPSVRRAVQVRPTASAPSTPATSRARPIWRSARRSRPASRRPTRWCRARACSTPSAALLTAYSMNAPVLALIGADSRRRYRPRPRPSARDPRPGRHHRAAGRSFGADPQRRARRRAWSREAMRAMATGRPGPAALECAIDVWGKPGAVTPQRAAAGARSPRSTRTRCARPPSSSARRRIR